MENFLTIKRKWEKTFIFLKNFQGQLLNWIKNFAIARYKLENYIEEDSKYKKCVSHHSIKGIELHKGMKWKEKNW